MVMTMVTLGNKDDDKNKNDSQQDKDTVKTYSVYKYSERYYSCGRNIVRL